MNFSFSCFQDDQSAVTNEPTLMAQNKTDVFHSTVKLTVLVCTAGQWQSKTFDPCYRRRGPEHRGYFGNVLHNKMNGRKKKNIYI